MFSALTYFFDHSIYFARLHHVNPLCKRQYAFLQMKESPNQKVQEKKKYKEKHVSGKNLEKMFSAPTPNGQWSYIQYQHTIHS